MRLICPNCDAQYEVDASLIPDSGRDVQCSDCGHVWFQAPDMGEFGIAPDDDDLAAVLPPGADAATQAPAPAPAAPFRATPDNEAPDDEERDDEEPEPDPQVLRRHNLDESLLAVLREEAERETRARAEETARAAGRGIEMQPELGLAQIETAPRLRIRPRAAPPPAAAADDDIDLPEALAPEGTTTPGLRQSRRDLLPDIDRINSTLDASNANRSGAAAVQVPDAPERSRSGFRRGFVTMLVIGATLWGAYAEADRLTAAMPQAAPLIDSFVGVVDKARAGLEFLVRGLLDTLNRDSV